MAYKGTAVAIGPEPVPIIDPEKGSLSRTFTISNPTGAATAYVGGEDVDEDNGTPIDGGGRFRDGVEQDDDVLYIMCPTASEVRLLERGAV